MKNYRGIFITLFYLLLLFLVGNVYIVFSREKDVVPMADNKVAGAFADLSITKTAFPDPIAIGQLLTYTLTVENNGPDTAVNTLVIDTLPISVTYAADDFFCDYQSGVVACDVGTMSNGTIQTIHIFVVPNEVGLITNFATVSSDIPDSDVNNNSVLVDTEVRSDVEADLAITKTVFPNSAVIGQIVTYTLSITNNGPNTAEDTVVQDILPPTLIYVSNDSGCEHLNGTVICNLGNLTSGTNQVVQMAVIPTQAEDVNNTATVSSLAVDPIPDNNLSSTTLYVNVPATLPVDLGLTKTTEPDSVVGEFLTYTLTITNYGPYTATDVTIIDILPEIVDYISSSVGCSEDSGTVICRLGTLSNGAVTTVQIVTTPNESGTASNTGHVFTTALDYNGNNNEDTTTTTVLPMLFTIHVPFITKQPICQGVIQISSSRFFGVTTFIPQVTLNFNQIVFDPFPTEMKLWRSDQPEPTGWLPYANTSTLGLNGSTFGAQTIYTRFKMGMAQCSLQPVTVFYIPNGDFVEAGAGGLSHWTVTNNLPVSIENGFLKLGNETYGCDNVPLGMAGVALSINVPPDSGYRLHVEGTIYTYDQLPDPLDDIFDAFEIHLNGNITRYGNPNPPLNCQTERQVGVADALSLQNYSGLTNVSLENHSRFDNYYNTYTKIEQVWIGP